MLRDLKANCDESIMDHVSHSFLKSLRLRAPDGPEHIIELLVLSGLV